MNYLRSLLFKWNIVSCPSFHVVPCSSLYQSWPPVSFLLDTLSSAHLSVSSVTALLQVPSLAPGLDQWTLSRCPLLPLLPHIRVCSPHPLGSSSPPLRPWFILQGPLRYHFYSCPDLSWVSYQFPFIALNILCIYVWIYEICCDVCRLSQTVRFLSVGPVCLP